MNDLDKNIIGMIMERLDKRDVTQLRYCNRRMNQIYCFWRRNWLLKNVKAKDISLSIEQLEEIYAKEIHEKLCSKYSNHNLEKKKCEICECMNYCCKEENFIHVGRYDPCNICLYCEKITDKKTMVII